MICSVTKQFASHLHYLLIFQRGEWFIFIFQISLPIQISCVYKQYSINVWAFQKEHVTWKLTFFLNPDHVSHSNILPVRNDKLSWVIVIDLAFSVIGGLVGFVSLVVFKGVLYHCKNENETKSSKHWGRVLWRKGHHGQDGDDKEIDVGYSSELKEKREGSPCEDCVFGCFDAVFLSFVVSSDLVFIAKVNRDDWSFIDLESKHILKSVLFRLLLCRTFWPLSISWRLLFSLYSQLLLLPIGLYSTLIISCINVFRLRARVFIWLPLIAISIWNRVRIHNIVKRLIFLGLLFDPSLLFFMVVPSTFGHLI